MSSLLTPSEGDCANGHEAPASVTVHRQETREAIHEGTATGDRQMQPTEPTDGPLA